MAVSGWVMMATAAAAAQPATAPAAPSGAVAGPPVSLTRVVFDLPRGARYEVLQAGLLCVTQRTLTWKGDPVVFEAQPYRKAFRTALRGEGVAAEGDPTDLFESQSTPAEFAVGALVTAWRMRACVNGDGFGSSLTNVRGDAAMTVDWQVFSRSTHQVVARVRTQAEVAQARAVPGDGAKLEGLAFAANAVRLARDEVFRHAIGLAGAAPPAAPDPP